MGWFTKWKLANQIWARREEFSGLILEVMEALGIAKRLIELLHLLDASMEVTSKAKAAHANIVQAWNKEVKAEEKRLAAEGDG